MADWRDRELMFSRTCELPFYKKLHAALSFLGTPVPGLPGCPDGCCNSVLVAAQAKASTDPQDWPKQSLALNGHDSQPGWARPWHFMQTLGPRFLGSPRAHSLPRPAPFPRHRTCRNTGHAKPDHATRSSAFTVAVRCSTRHNVQPDQDRNTPRNPRPPVQSTRKAST